MKCVICGRRLNKPAATLPARTSGPDPHPAGPVGPTCARNQGLITATLFTRRKPALTVKPRRDKTDKRQIDWVSPA